MGAAEQTLIALMVLVAVGGYLWAILDAARTPRTAYQSIGHSKIGWLVVIIIGTGAGIGLYLVAARPQLRGWLIDQQSDGALGEEEDAKRYLRLFGLLGSLVGLSWLAAGLIGGVPWWVVVGTALTMAGAFLLLAIRESNPTG
jgi:hypothetical protein